MKRTILIYPLLLFLLSPLFADDAWNALKSYQYGDDFQPLLAVEAEVQRSLASPETKTQTAARLAVLLDDDTTLAGRQFVCMQLRLVGGAAEVPKLTEYLNKPGDSENARLALTDILCDESLIPLRASLETSRGQALVGVIGSLAARHDRPSIPAFVRLLDATDTDVAVAAAAALGHFGAEGIETLSHNRERLPKAVGNALIRIASGFTEQGMQDEAAAIYDLLLSADMPKGVRRAALEGTLRLLDAEKRLATITAWLFDADTEKGVIAASHLSEISAEQSDELFKKSETMNTAGRTAIFEIVSERDEAATLDVLLQAMKSDNSTERLTAIRAIGHRGDASTIPALLEALGRDDATKNAARDAFIRFPQENVGPVLLEALQNDALRNPVIETIVAMKYYAAIDSLVELAQSENESVSVPAIEGLAKLCDPDEHDLPRLVRLYLTSRPGAHRERVERALVVVCEKIPDAEIRADQLIAILEQRDGGLSGRLLIDALPLLGKVGNRKVSELLHPILDDRDPVLQRAAIRALCNWPNADNHTELWDIASNNASREYAQWALRAYIRVVTLKSDRLESETLAMLQNAMKLANNDSDRRLCLNRAATVRTIEAVEWIAGFLDTPALAQTACETLAELAHHRFLREPNKERFDPILIKVENTAKDSRIVESVKKSRLGL